MKEVKTDINTLYAIYVAGFNHGVNGGPFGEIGTFEAFERLIKGESPLLNSTSYQIQNDIIFLSPNTPTNE